MAGAGVGFSVAGLLVAGAVAVAQVAHVSQGSAVVSQAPAQISQASAVVADSSFPVNQASAAVTDFSIPVTHASVIDDPAMDRAVAEARAEFLALRRQNQPEFTRLDATVLVRQADGSWRRGSFGGEELHYPASTVKLAYMAAAAKWERENGKPVGFLEPHVGPMIIDSDNPATGRVVDAITGTTNVVDAETTASMDGAVAPAGDGTSVDAGSPSDAVASAGDGATSMSYADWKAARMYTADYLTGRGLLANQVIHVKTYPTNSGPAPVGFEERMWKELGRNMMQTSASASLMLEIVTGALEPRSTEYMRRLLKHERWGSGSVVGFGLPPGALYENKPGRAYDTLADIAYTVLPGNDREVVLAVLSNAYSGSEPDQPGQYSGAILGVFTELLLEKLGLEAGAPPKIRRDNRDAAFFMAEGDWETSTSASEKFGGDYLVLGDGHNTADSGPELDSGGTPLPLFGASWRLDVPQDGKYEVSAWHVQSPDNTTSAVYQVAHDDGVTTVASNQQRNGGRWVKLGDFSFAAGSGAVTISRAEGSTGTLTADAVKAVMWPAE